MCERDERDHLDPGAEVVHRFIEIEGRDHVTGVYRAAGGGDDKVSAQRPKIDIVAVDRLQRAAVVEHLVAVKQVAAGIRKEKIGDGLAVGVDRDIVGFARRIGVGGKVLLGLR